MSNFFFSRPKVPYFIRARCAKGKTRLKVADYLVLQNLRSVRRLYRDFEEFEEVSEKVVMGRRIELLLELEMIYL